MKDFLITIISVVSIEILLVFNHIDIPIYGLIGYGSGILLMVFYGEWNYRQGQKRACTSVYREGYEIGWSDCIEFMRKKFKEIEKEGIK